ncbi:MAG: sulfurtransferase TusA family protein, partial [Christensenella sp.]
MMQIDARGKACPQPVILAKKELDNGSRDITVLVDNRAAVENLTRLGNSAGVAVATGEAEGGFFVRLTGEAKPGVLPEIACPATGNDYAVFIGKDVV